MTFKVYYKISFFLAAVFFTTFLVNGQEPVIKSNEKEKVVVNPMSAEEKEWKEIRNKITLVCETSEECEKYENGSFWYQREFEDKLMRNRNTLVESFLRKYPKSSHYFDALKYYFTYLAEPQFLDSALTKNKKIVLDQQIDTVKGDRSKFYQKFRALPFNVNDRGKWIKKGDSLASKFLKSGASSDKKALIEVAVLGRDLRLAISLYEFLHLNKKIEEKEFWILFDKYFWKEFIIRTDQLIFKYPDYPRWPALIDQLNSSITEYFLSPEMKEYYWEHFKNVTDKPELFDEHPVLVKVHEKAVKSLQAMEVLKTFDENQPLQMQFTSMRGEKIDLKEYRGKVVLIDFWSIRCGPCIKEMPHIRAMYDKYKDQGFEVIGIAAEGDDDKQRVLEIIRKQGANWPHLLDKGYSNTISFHTLYDIHALPTTWLLNQEGIIVDKNARGDRLEPLLKGLLQ